ncbi:DNA polymerase III subunit delta [Pelagicoccus sp. SDUM812003]|uniref:DNA polymerase III subunit delta n=1 Tax=Pelagicoccus sp. SDUM812003 TaxID=3041267 RepID=UPI0028101286|nr:DNA polymerase III subunit delta [Pelagicoccus sp. SDUM812003]MDQ8201729.1 DNA polymerase III subunit delta [Pelagicoccus sp. SDUM812003]
MSQAPFIYVSGPDDFLASRLAKEIWTEMKQEVTDDFSVEIINGHAGKVDEVADAVNRFREATQTLGLFGGRRVVWLKDVSFLADNQTGRAEGTQTLCQDLQEILEAINPDEVGVLISASPVDRRKRFPKFLEKTGDFRPAGGMDSKGGGVETLVAAMTQECQSMGVSIARDAVEVLISKVNGNSRLLLEEVRKLGTYLGPEGGEITSKLIEELTPNFGEGDFFESTEAFFSRDIDWTLAALRRHFFAGNDARPVIASLQNRNRLLIQLRSLIDGGEIRLGGRGFSKPEFEKAAAKYASYYDGLSGKSNYNVFTQNLWYMGKLAGTGRLPTLKALIDHQLDFITAFEEIVERPNEQEEALRAMAIRCLAA